MIEIKVKQTPSNRRFVERYHWNPHSLKAGNPSQHDKHSNHNVVTENHRDQTKTTCFTFMSMLEVPFAFIRNTQRNERYLSLSLCLSLSKTERGRARSQNPGESTKRERITSPIACFVKQCSRHINRRRAVDGGHFTAQSPVELRFRATVYSSNRRVTSRAEGGFNRKRRWEKENERGRRLISCFKCGTESEQGQDEKPKSNRESVRLDGCTLPFANR